MKRKVHAAKEFLNLAFHHSDASIFTEIEVVVSDGSNWPDINIMCRIRDCDRVISLSFDDPYGVDEDVEFYKEYFENHLFKVDTLIKQLRKFRTGLKKAHAIYIAEYEEYLRLEEKKKSRK